jgi:subfamily B ATP-binding cassette protein MsbA
VNNFSRIAGFVWPYRWRVILSVFCAIAISLLWAGNLSSTMPIVRVLFDNQNLHQFVTQDMAKTEANLEQRRVDIEKFRNDETKREELAKAQRDQSEETQHLAALDFVRKFILPWVPRDRFNTVALILGMLVVATFLKGVFIFLQEVLVGGAVYRTIVDIRQACFDHAISLDYQTLSAEGDATLMSRMTNDVETMAAGIRSALVRFIREPLKAGGCILFAFYFNWRLTLMSILVVPLMAFAFHRFGRSLKRAAHGTLQSMTEIFKCLSETLDSMKVVIAFGGEKRHAHQLRVANRTYYKQSMKVIRLSALARPTTELMGTFAVLAAVLPGAYLVLRETDTVWGIQLAGGPIDSAELATLYALLAGTLDSVRKLSSVYSDMKRAGAASDRIFEILDKKTKVPEPESPTIAAPLVNEIRFEDVSFSYAQRESDGTVRPPALRNIDLTVKAGEVVAVIGENGSGKSTLLNLLPRLMDPDQGSVQLDGVDIRHLHTRDLRSQIGLVTQETLLFDDTLLENIRYGNPEATTDQLEAAAEQAHVNSFASQLPDGFNTAVGDKGQKLSGGQRQRVSLARAIVRDPSILILDEATSAIDSQSEQLIHRVLKQFVKGRTVFIITHVINDTFLDLVTRIVVLDQGRIAAMGTHEELVDSSPIYQRLYHSSASTRAA